VIRWRRVVSIALVTVAVAATVVLAPVAFFALRAKARAAVHPIIATDPEQREILRMLVETQDYSGDPPPPPGLDAGRPVSKKTFVVLSDRTVALCAETQTVPAGDGQCPSWSTTLSPADVDPGIPERLVRELMAGNREAQPAAAPVLPGLVVANQAEIEALLSADDWQPFYARYPDSAGLLRTTRAVVSADRSQALIYAEYYCGLVCGTGTVHYLKRTGGSWTIERSFRYRIS